MVTEAELKAKGFNDKQIKELNDLLKNNTETAKENAKATQELSDVYKDFGDVLENLQKNAQGTLPKLFLDAKNPMASLQETMAKYPQIAAAAVLATGKLNDAFKGLSGNLSDMTGFETYEKRHMQLVQFISGSKDQLSAASAALGMNPEKIKSDADKAGISIVEFTTKTLQASRNQQLFNDTLLKTAATTGQLDVLKEQINKYGTLDAVGADYVQQLKQIQLNTGKSTEETLKYYTAMMKVPGMLDMVSSELTNSEGSAVSFGEALITMSEGTQIPMETLTSQVNQLRDSFNVALGKGSSGDEALKFLAAMDKASHDLGMSYETLRGHINTLASTFKMYGNTSQDLVKDLHQVSKALEATGLSAQNSGELAQKYIANINNLSLAQKAFISQQTGGPGGLQGAFDIDALLREGKFDEVFKKVQESMREQMGGDLVTLQQARESPEAASQYAKQITMLQQGPLGQFASTPAEAERLADAMATGGIAQQTALDDMSEIAKQSYKDGKERQKQNATVYSKMQDVMDAMRIDTQVIAQAATQYMSGNKALIGGEIYQNKMISEMKERTTRLAPGPPTTIGEAPKTVDERMARTTMDSFANLAKGIGSELVEKLFPGMKVVGDTKESAEKRIQELQGKREAGDLSSVEDFGAQLLEKILGKSIKDGMPVDDAKKALTDVTKQAAKPESKTPTTRTADGKSEKTTDAHVHGGAIPFFCNKCQRTILEDIEKLISASPQAKAADSTGGDK